MQKIFFYKLIATILIICGATVLTSYSNDDNAGL